MRAETRTVSIDAPPDRVIAVVADAQQLPRWALGFARTVEPRDGSWIVTTAAGEVGLQIAADPATGVVDFWMTPAPGVKGLAASRVVPRGTGSEYVFTQFQAPGMSDDAFAASVRAIEHELTVLKALVEVECPL